MVSILITVKSSKICFVNVYVPNSDDVEFFTNLINRLQLIEADHAIVGGDFNKVLNAKLDKKGGVQASTKSAKLLNTFLENDDWVDVWRSMYPETFQFTWHQKKLNIMSRLDYFLTHISTFGIVRECSILPAILSDHCPVLLTLELNNQIRGPGYWKLDTKHLSNPEFVEEVNKIIDFANFRYDNLNPLNKWEMIKHDIHQFTIAFSHSRATLRKQEIAKWTRQIVALQKCLAMINLKADNAIKIIRETNEKIDILTEKLRAESWRQTQGAKLRSKARWVEEGEKSTKYFFNLERYNAKAKIMNSTYNECGLLTSNPKEILKIQANYFSKLFTSDTNIECKIDITPEKQLSEKQKCDLDVDLQIDEVSKAIKEMAKDKTPGTSGFQVNMYVMFWTRLKEPLFNAFRFVYAKGYLNESARRGLITLIPKKDRYLNYVKNWRPIILLNTDYKIIAKVIANRLKTVLPDIIHHNQTGFMKERLISMNLRKILDTINYVESQNMPGVFFAIDFQKAFDRVEYSSLYKIMKWFNFGQNIINWIKLLFTNIKIATLNNGYTSPYCRPTRALFQGNPVASFLFIIVIELLAVQIR